MDFYELEHLVSSNKVLKMKDRYVVMSIILTRFTMGGRSIAQVPFQVHHVKITTGCPRKSTFLRFRVLDHKWSKNGASDPKQSLMVQMVQNIPNGPKPEISARPCMSQIPFTLHRL